MLEVAGLKRSYDAFRLGPLDLSVGDEVLAVLGPSGCGKTTLLSLLAGIEAPDDGTVTLDGTHLDGRPAERRGTVLVFQDGALFPHMTARENVAYAATDPAVVADLAGRLDIEAVLDQRAATLSGGEAQRVALARALAADPEALLLDEPLANLDAPIRRQLRVDLREVLGGLPIPVVYVTHDQTEASSVGDRVAVMRDGAFEQIGTPASVFAHPATPFVAGFTGSANVFRGAIADGDRLRWAAADFEATVDGFEAGEPVWFTVRPEYVEVVHLDAAGENIVAGRVANRLFEGGRYRLVVRPDGLEETLDVLVPAPAYAEHRLAERDRLAVRLPPEAIHVVGPAGDRAAAGSRHPPERG